MRERQDVEEWKIQQALGDQATIVSKPTPNSRKTAGTGLALQLLRELLDRLLADGNRRRGGTPADCGDTGVELRCPLGTAVGEQLHVFAVQQNRGNGGAVDLEQDDAAAHRHRTVRRVKGDVLLLADLAADVAEHARRDRCREIAALLIRVEDEFVDDDLGVARNRQRRLIGE